MCRLEQHQLHEVFLRSLGKAVVSHSDIDIKPLETDLNAPDLPHRVRVYLYNATDPPGGRTLGEHKIQLIVPGQIRGGTGTFDDSGGRIVLLCGYNASTDVFILWDAGMYPEFTYSRNVQVMQETITSALAGNVALQNRRIRGRGMEIIVAARSDNLKKAIEQRMKLTRQRMLVQR